MDTQQYEIVLAPDLALSPADFMETWNATAETRSKATASMTTTSGSHFDLIIIGTILLTVATGVASNVISELIMKTLEKRGVPSHHTHIEHVKKPDGSESFIVDIDE